MCSTALPRGLHESNGFELLAPSSSRAAPHRHVLRVVTTSRDGYIGGRVQPPSTKYDFLEDRTYGWGVGASLMVRAAGANIFAALLPGMC